MASRTYVVGASTIRVIFGDITASGADVIVSSDDTWISAGGGVSQAIRRAAGGALEADSQKLHNHPVGDVVVTGAGRLPAKYVFHAITIGPAIVGVDRGMIVRNATQKAMQLLPMLGCQSIAFPTIGAGAAGIPYPVVVSEMAGALIDVLLDNPGFYHVDLYLRDRRHGLGERDLFDVIEEYAAAKFALNLADAVPAGDRRPHSQGAEADVDGAARRTEIAAMMRKLDARRQVLESSLMELLTTTESAGADEIEPLRRQLSEIAQLRGLYERELRSGPSTPTADARDAVFVSSTSQDLGAHRAAVREVIERLRLTFVGMEDFVPEATAPGEMIRRRVQESGVYVGILGMRYGHVDAGTGLSMTELEYQQAIASDKPLRIFVMDKDAPITASMVEQDPENLRKLNEFKSTVMNRHSCNLFTSQEDLAWKVERALSTSG